MRILNVVHGSYKEVVIPDAPYVRLDKWLPPDTGVLLTGFRIHQHEKNSVIQCFNDVNHVYAFGHDPDGSMLSVTYLVFLGKGCMKDKFEASSSMNEFVRYYLGQRISKHKDMIYVTFSRSGYVRFMLLDYDVSVYDPELNAVSITFSGKSL